MYLCYHYLSFKEAYIHFRSLEFLVSPSENQRTSFLSYKSQMFTRTLPLIPTLCLVRLRLRTCHNRLRWKLPPSLTKSMSLRSYVKHFSAAKAAQRVQMSVNLSVWIKFSIRLILVNNIRRQINSLQGFEEEIN